MPTYPLEKWAAFNKFSTSSLILQKRPLQNKCVARSIKLDPNDLWMITQYSRRKQDDHFWHILIVSSAFSYEIRWTQHSRTLIVHSMSKDMDTDKKERKKGRTNKKRQKQRTKERMKDKKVGTKKKNEIKTEMCSIAKDHPPVVHRWAPTTRD